IGVHCKSCYRNEKSFCHYTGGKSQGNNCPYGCLQGGGLCTGQGLCGAGGRAQHVCGGNVPQADLDTGGGKRRLSGESPEQYIADYKGQWSEVMPTYRFFLFLFGLFAAWLFYLFY